MRTLAMSAGLAVLLTCQVAWAQAPASTGGVVVASNYDDGYYWRPHSSTLQEGIGHGIGDVLRSAGQYDLLRSQAAINYQEARRLALDNATKGVNTYFDMRRLNDQARAQMRGPRLSRDDYARLAQAVAPRRLSPGELDPATGRIVWPILLQADEFADSRVQLDRLFATRTNVGLTTDNYLDIHRLIGQLTDELRAYVADMPPMDYTVAKRFLGSLAMEARAPLEPVTRIGMIPGMTR